MHTQNLSNQELNTDYPVFPNVSFSAIKYKTKLLRWWIFHGFCSQALLTPALLKAEDQYKRHIMEQELFI